LVTWTIPAAISWCFDRKNNDREKPLRPAEKSDGRADGGIELRLLTLRLNGAWFQTL
jgi:hypothetical protein